VARAAGFAPEPMAGGALSWVNWGAGVVSVYATLFGVGSLIFGRYGEALAYLLAAAAAFALIARNLRQAEPLPAPAELAAEPAVPALAAK
jgi:hypothetical protein